MPNTGYGVLAARNWMLSRSGLSDECSRKVDVGPDPVGANTDLYVRQEGKHFV